MKGRHRDRRTVSVAESGLFFIQQDGRLITINWLDCLFCPSNTFFIHLSQTSFAQLVCQPPQIPRLPRAAALLGTKLLDRQQGGDTHLAQLTRSFTLLSKENSPSGCSF